MILRELKLEDALIQSYHTIEFLHGCLTDPVYAYKYPEDTLKRLEDIKKLVAIPKRCVHSRHIEGCPECVSKLARHKLKYELERDNF